MTLAHRTSRRLSWPLIVGAVIILSLLPSRLCVYAPPLGRLVTTALAPLTIPLRSLTAALYQRFDRPVLGTEQQLTEKVLYLQGRNLALEQRIRELEMVNAELQGLRQRLGERYIFRRAAVISRSSDPSAGTLQINLGSSNGLRPGLAAVEGMEGANLLGLISDVGRSVSTLKPLTSPGNLIEVVFVAADLSADAKPLDRGRTALLKPDGPDALIAADAPHDLPVEVGDFARLSDSSGPAAWPQVVQGMIVGRVTSIEPDPDDPLRKLVRVRPLLSLYHVEAVTVIVPRKSGEDDAERSP